MWVEPNRTESNPKPIRTYSFHTPNGCVSTIQRNKRLGRTEPNRTEPNQTDSSLLVSYSEQLRVYPTTEQATDSNQGYSYHTPNSSVSRPTTDDARSSNRTEPNQNRGHTYTAVYVAPPWGSFQARLLDKQEGADTERCVRLGKALDMFATPTFLAPTLFQLSRYRAWKIGSGVRHIHRRLRNPCHTPNGCASVLQTEKPSRGQKTL